MKILFTIIDRRHKTPTMTSLPRAECHIKLTSRESTQTTIHTRALAVTVDRSPDDVINAIESGDDLDAVILNVTQLFTENRYGDYNAPASDQATQLQNLIATMNAINGNRQEEELDRANKLEKIFQDLIKKNNPLQEFFKKKK